MSRLRNKILEAGWLACAFLAVSAGIHKTIRFGFSESYVFYLIFILSLVVFFVKRKKRLNTEKTR